MCISIPHMYIKIIIDKKKISLWYSKIAYDIDHGNVNSPSDTQNTINVIQSIYICLYEHLSDGVCGNIMSSRMYIVDKI